MACSSCWTGELIYTKTNGQQLFFRTTANYILDQHKNPVSITLVSHNITDVKLIEQHLLETENEYNVLINTIFDGVILMHDDYKIAACNKRAAQILGLRQEEATGRVLASTSWSAIKADGSEFPTDEFPAIVSLRTGKQKNDVVMGVLQPNGTRVWISINSRPLFKDNEKKPRSVVVSFKDITREKEKAEELNKTEALFKTFIHNSKTAAWIYDEEGNILLANDVYNTITNAPPGGAAGLHLLELFANEWGQKLIDRNKEFLKNSTQQIAPKDLVQADGSVRTFISYLFRIELADGRRLIGGQALDITDTKAANEKLKQSEALFRSFMSSAPTLSWIFNEEGILVFANPKFINELGTSEDIIGKSYTEIALTPEFEKLVARRINEVLVYNSRNETEDILIMPNGEKRYYASHWYLIQMADGKKLVGGHAHDITEKKINNQQLKDLKEKYEYALKATSDAFWDMDMTTKEVFRSERFNLISGYSAKEIEPTLSWWYNKIHPDDRQRVKNKVDYRLANSMETWEDEYRFQFADKSYRYISDKAYVIYNNRMPVRMVGAIQDITDKKELEKRVIQSEILKQSQINMAAIHAQEIERDEISKELHDNVNQVLTSAKLYMSIARDNPCNFIDLLDKAIEYQMVAIEEIRNLSKALSSTLISSVGLKDSVEGIIQNLEFIQLMNVEFEFDGLLDEKLSNEQKLMLLRIVQEQTNNIIKYAKAQNVQLLIKEINGKVYLVINDDGIGFDTLIKSTGLGLSNIYSRAHALKGKIKIISAPAEGCSLDLVFPLKVGE
jgi:PAS domain S-box-containing protein